MTTANTRSAKSTTAVESRRLVKARATRDQVVAAARRLFERRGFASVTLREVADEARLSTGAVFSSFDGKEGLFKAAFPTDHRALRMAEAMCDAYYAAQVWASGSSALRDRWISAANDVLARPSIASRAA